MKKKPERHMSTVKLGLKGQIVIPKDVREMFGISPGDSLVLLADPERGIAIQTMEVFSAFTAVFEGKGKVVKPEDLTGKIPDSPSPSPENDEE